jgi:hypothetical protein
MAAYAPLTTPCVTDCVVFVKPFNYLLAFWVVFDKFFLPVEYALSAFVAALVFAIYLSIAFVSAAGFAPFAGNPPLPFSVKWV